MGDAIKSLFGVSIVNIPFKSKFFVAYDRYVVELNGYIAFSIVLRFIS